MEKLNEKIYLRNYEVRNMMATCQMPFGIKVEELATKYKDVEYEPEINPWGIWRLKEPKATILVFTTGSITITGGKYLLHLILGEQACQASLF